MTRLSAQLFLLLLALLALPAVMGDNLYKWVDDQGNVHYSDKPQPGATKLHLPKPTTFSAPETAGNAGSETKKPAPAPSASYTGFAISSPTADEVYWNVQSVTVTVSLQPALKPGDTVTITLDGNSQGPGADTSATFDDLERGEHTVQATLQMAKGGSMSTKPVTFYIQKSTQK
jgi:Domain of unknown function (DUF4124)